MRIELTKQIKEVRQNLDLLLKTSAEMDASEHSAMRQFVVRKLKRLTAELEKKDETK